MKNGISCLFLAICMLVSTEATGQDMDWETGVKERVRLFTQVEWRAKSPVPRLVRKDPDAAFKTDRAIKGLPYSQNTTLRTLIGADISVYTFLSAAQNPESALYKVNLRKEPYNKEKAATYYGTHCASCVSYAWGLPGNVSVGQFYNDLGIYSHVAGNDIDSIRVFDALAYEIGNHVRMAYEIDRDAEGRIESIVFFEGWPPTARLKRFSREEIQTLFDKNKARIVRADKDVIAKLFVPDYLRQSAGDFVGFPEDICLYEGDRKSFKETDTVRINILSSGYRSMEIVKDGKTLSSRKVKSVTQIALDHMAPGLYEAYLKNGSRHSDTTRFEVIDTTCVIRLIENGVEVCPVGKGVRPLFVKFKKSKIDAPAFFYSETADGKWIAEGRHDKNSVTLLGLAGTYGTVTCRMK